MKSLFLGENAVMGLASFITILEKNHCLDRNFILQIQSGQPLDETSIACILRDLLHAVEYLHNEGKIHRDIKGIVINAIVW